VTLPALLLALYLPWHGAASLFLATEMETAIAAQEDPALWHAVWQVECGGQAVCSRSKAGACCPLQVLGARYGNPPCDLLEASAWLCVVTADRQMERCRRMCGKVRATGCYHSGRCDGNESYTAAVKAARRAK